MERHAAIERVGHVVFARADQIVPRAGAMRDDSTGQVAGFGFEMFPYVLGAFQRKSFVDRLGTGAAGVADDFHSAVEIRRLNAIAGSARVAAVSKPPCLI